MRKRDLLRAFLLDLFFWSYALLVCYKVIYEKTILDVRYPKFSWMQPLWALAMGAGMAAILFLPRSFSLGKRILGIYSGSENRPWIKEPYAVFSVFFLIITFWAGIHFSQISIREFFSESGMAGARKIFVSLFQPNFSILGESVFAAIETIYMAFIATAFALPLAFLLSFFSARNLMIQNKILFGTYLALRFILNVTRAIEPLIWAIIFSVWVGIGPFAGMLALCLHSVSSLAKLYSEQIENIDEGPLEAMTATGAHPIQVIWFGVVPQIILPFLSFTIYRWDINVRMATVIGLVGGGGIGTLLMQYQGLGKWNEVGLIVLIIASIVWAMDYASAKIREAIR
jgi:phosphonate transport system permease protein